MPLASVTEVRGLGRQSGPPPIPFVLAVGITGHRADVLPEGSVPILRDRIRDALERIEQSGRSLLVAEQDCFAPTPPVMRFVSPIADGADQIAAEVALELGWELQAIVPFERGVYRDSLANHGARERYDALLDRAACVLELPGDPDNSLDAYVMTGRATVAHCDVLLAVWDGLPPRGRGGTGEVVQLALTRGTAIIPVPLAPGGDTRVLWSAFDPTVLTVADDPSVARPLARGDVDKLLRGLLMGPPDEVEQAFLRKFLSERSPRIRARVEYALLLTATGVRRFRASDLTTRHAEAQIRDEWARYRAGCAEAHNIKAPIGSLEEAYSWADRLATHFAQTYRSGHIFKFRLGGFAVCMGLSAFMAPAHRFALAMAEFFITLAIIVNTILGTRNEWHRRWLDYRQLAERLRPMRSFKLLGIAAPDPAGTNTNPVPARWIEWYSAAVWRAMGCPSARISPQRADLIAESVADHEVAPQVGYHERHSRTIAKLDNRLDWIGTMLFFATLVVSIATLIGLGIGARFVDILGDWFTLVSAGFPALGTAIFGIRFQGDFGGSSVRSQSTANALKEIEQELRKYTTLTRAADLTEQAARVMLSDLDEWALINQRQELSV